MMDEFSINMFDTA